MQANESKEKTTLTVTLDYNVLANLHPLFAAKAMFTDQRKLDRSHIIETIDLHIPPGKFLKIAKEVDYLFQTVHSTNEWIKHRDHFYAITALFLEVESGNENYKSYSRLKARGLAEAIIKIDAILNGSYGSSVVLIQSPIKVDVTEVATEVLKTTRVELEKKFHWYLENDPLATDPYDYVKKVKKAGKYQKSNDRLIGHLAYILANYLQEVANFKNADALNFTGKDISINLSNEQGYFIAAYLKIFELFKFGKTADHLLVRQYIYAYIESI